MFLGEPSLRSGAVKLAGAHSPVLLIGLAFLLSFYTTNPLHIYYGFKINDFVGFLCIKSRESLFLVPFSFSFFLSFLFFLPSSDVLGFDLLTYFIVTP